MEKVKFQAMLILIVPKVVHLIAEKYNLDELVATDMFYSSKVYEKLEQEDTKVWHFSPITIFNMFCEDYENGEFNFPEESQL